MTCISSALAAASLPGDVRGLFELISREAAGFYSWWQQEYVSELTASPWAGVCWEARRSLGQDALCGWECKAPCYQSVAIIQAMLVQDRPGGSPGYGQAGAELTAGCWGSPCPFLCTGQGASSGFRQGFGFGFEFF